jgi:DNA-binding transcriptional LysR family regulator
LLPRALKDFRARYPLVQLDITEGRFPFAESLLKVGIIDLYIGPMPKEVIREFSVEHLYDQEMAILCRKGHPLARAHSLRELTHAEWLTNSVMADPEDELVPFFLAKGLPRPRLAVQSHSALTILTVVGHSDLLTLVPADFARSDLGRTLLQRIAIKDSIPVAPLVMIRRAAVPLTPAAECFGDMIRRASVHFVQSRAAHAED